MKLFSIVLSIALFLSIQSLFAINEPILVSPSNGATNQPVSITLDWSSVTGNVGYIYELDTTSNFNSPLLVTGASAINSSQITINDLRFGTIYYWRAATKSAVDTSLWTSTWSFTTGDNVTLVSPSNAATGQPVSVTLDWSTFGGNTGYLYEIDIVSTFDSPSYLAGASVINSSQMTVNDLMFGTTYYWRAAVKNNVDTSQWSSIWSFTTADNVTLVSPANGATNQPVSVDLDWSAMTGNSGYLYEIDIVSTFDSPSYIAGASVINSSQMTVNDLRFGTTYYWRAAAKNNADTSQWSTIWSFTTADNLSLVSPSNNATSQPVSVTLDWAAFGGNIGYLYKIDTVSTFDSPLFLEGTTAINSSQMMVNNLRFGTTYYWCAAVKNNVDTSQWSSIWSFTTADNVILVSPANGATNQAVSLTIDWTPLDGNTGYLYELDIVPSFNSGQIITGNSPINSSQASVSSLLYGTTYYWRAAAKNNVDTSQWTSPWTFTTSYQLTIAPNLISPANLSNNIPQNGQVFTWDTIAGITSFEIQYSLDNTFNNGVFSQIITNTNYIINGLNSNSTYYWRVRGKNITGNSPWSSVWSFNTITCTATNTINEVSCDTYNFNGNIINASGTYLDTIIGSGGCDSIITLNLTINNSTSSTQTLSACFSYTTPSGNYTWTSSGTYYDVIPNSSGCDSTITYYLTINNVDTSIINNSPTLTSNASGGIYQWLDCNNSYSIINGETNQSFTASANGNYAVEINQNGCIDTSYCININSVNIYNELSSNDCNVFPNPTTGKIFVKVEGILNIEILNIQGKLVFRGVDPEIDLSQNAKGIYIIKVATIKGLFIDKIVIE